MNPARHEVRLALASTGVAVVIYGLLAAVGVHLGLRLLPEAESAAPQVVRARLAGDEPRRPSRPLSERSFRPTAQGSRLTPFGSRRGPLLERVHAPRLPAAPGRARNGRRSPMPPATPPTTPPSGGPSVRPEPRTQQDLPGVPQLPTPPPPALPQLPSVPPAPPAPPPPAELPNLGVPTVPLPELPGAPTVPDLPPLP